MEQQTLPEENLADFGNLFYALDLQIKEQSETIEQQAAAIKELLEGLENALKQFGGLGNTDDLKQLLNKHKP